MAPTMITRSMARKNGVIFQCLGAGVHKAIQRITCNKRHGSRAALSHFKSHSIRHDEVSMFAPPTKLTHALVGVKNGKQLQRKEDQTRLRLLHWWFGVNEELFLRKGELELPGQGQLSYVNSGTAEEDNLVELVNSLPIKQAGPLSTGNAPTAQADRLASDPDQATYSASAETGFFDHDFDRSLKGSVIADFELASTRPLTSLPLLWCMSNTFTHFVKTRGEDLITAVALKRATEAYLDTIGVSQDLLNKLNSRFDYRIMSKYEDVDRCAEEDDKPAARLGDERRFRKDRAFVWDVLEEAVTDYFNDYDGFELPVALGARRGSDAVKVVVKATWTFVRLLDDAETSRYMRKYWNGKI